VLDAAASNRDGFLWRDTFVSSTQLIYLLGANRAYLHLKKPNLQKGFLKN
jgi:hypothetical protein